MGIKKKVLQIKKKYLQIEQLYKNHQCGQKEGGTSLKRGRTFKLEKQAVLNCGN